MMTGGATAAITTLVVALLAYAIGRGRPKSNVDGGGAIAPERLSALFTVFMGVLMSLGGVFASFSGGGGLRYGPLSIVFGAVIAGFMAPSLTDLHVVRWSSDGVEGPSKTFGLTLGTKRTTIRWGDIRRTGKTLTGYWFIESEDRRRVYWSYLYKGYGAFVQALTQHCPTVPLPKDLT